MAYDAAKDFYRRSKDPVGPARVASAVIPSDEADLEVYPKTLYVGTGGDVAVIPVDSENDSPVVFKNVPDGGYILVSVRRVFADATTAADIVALAG